VSWRSVDIHAAADWLSILPALGIDASHLVNRHRPCPIHGGTKPFRFDNKDGRGTWICSSCGAGDAFRLLQLVHGWSFREARDRVLEVMGVARESNRAPRSVARPTITEPIAPARPSRRATEILRTACAVETCGDAIAYLQSRLIWPLPSGCTLRAHAALEYWDELVSPTGESTRELVGRFAALIADVRDIAGELVTLHVTYLRGGQKLQKHAPRKILGAMHGHRGLAVRLMPAAGDVLGVGEGIETCLAAHALHGVPTWAALNAALLGKFEPPPQIRHVIAFCDADRAGYEAWDKLRENLDGRCTCERRTPAPPHNDWCDVLEMRGDQR
jgi:putative DNA primase/helicase